MPSSSSTPQTFAHTIHTHTRPSARYHQVDYYDGRNVICVADSRRRQHVTRTAAPLLSPTRRLPSLTGRKELVPDANAPFHSGSTDAALEEPATRANPRATPRYGKTMAKVVIVQATSLTKEVKGEVRKEVEMNVILTPPRTPEIGRLPTPDLDDVGGKPFCNCCRDGSEKHVCT
jgi:hypothetical protein